MRWIWSHAGIAIILVWNGAGQNLVWLLLDFCRNLKPCKSAQERCRLPPAMRKQTNSERATLHMHFAQCTYITIKPIDLGSLRVILLKRSINCFSFDVEAGEHWWKALPVREDLETMVLLGSNNSNPNSPHPRGSTPSVFKVLNGFVADYDQNFYLMDIDQSSLPSPLLLLPPRPPSNKIGVQLYLINHPNCRFALCIFASQTSLHFKLFRFSNWLLLG